MEYKTSKKRKLKIDKKENEKKKRRLIKINEYDNNKLLIKIQNKINNSLKFINNFKLNPTINKSVSNCVVTCSKILYDKNGNIYETSTNSLNNEKKYILYENPNTTLRTQKFPSVQMNVLNPTFNISIFPGIIHFLSKDEIQFKFYFIYFFSNYLYEKGLNNILHSIEVRNEVRTYDLGFKFDLKKFRNDNGSIKPQVITCAKHVFKFKGKDYIVQIFPTGKYNILGLNLEQLQHIDIVNEIVRKKFSNYQLNKSNNNNNNKKKKI